MEQNRDGPYSKINMTQSSINMEWNLISSRIILGGSELMRVLSKQGKYPIQQLVHAGDYYNFVAIC